MISVSARSDFHSAVREIGQMMTNGYESIIIPINTIFRGMNIHLPGVQGFDPLPNEDLLAKKL